MKNYNATTETNTKTDNDTSTTADVWKFLVHNKITFIAHSQAAAEYAAAARTRQEAK